MSLRRILDKDATFGRAERVAMITAYELALRRLGLHTKIDPVTELIAGKIIALAAAGEHDPDKLSNAAVEAFRDDRAA
jgi:hypothetical protein